MTKVSEFSLAALRAYDPDKGWAGYVRTEEQAQRILKELETTGSWEDDGKPSQEDIDDIFARVRDDYFDDGEGEDGEGSPGDDVSPEETPGEGQGEAQGEAQQPERFDLEEFIVGVSKRRRDEILEGLEWGGRNGRTLTVHVHDAPPVEFENAHAMLPTLVTVLAQREPVLAVGPAGSGKTTAFIQAAQALGVGVRVNSNSRMDTYTKAFGYVHPGTSTYQEGYMYGPMKHGMLLADDEVDASNENVMVSKNTAIENRFAWFPNGEEVQADENFFYAGSANTYGRGADRMYVGRTQLDAATLDRFVVIDWDYDEELEMELSTNTQWTEWVQKVRHAVFEHKMRYIVSPRASIKGGKLIAAGIPERQVRNMVVFKGWPEADQDKIMRAIS